ncbi:MAG TPA: type I restriction endonuclease subunit R, partial [Gallicola sp.]|nr:type I restriction endonuclease subunit R [Gallicola sp.]
DKQIHKTFVHTKMKTSRANTGKHLVDLISNDNADIITTLVHKFDTAVNNQKPVLSNNIFVLVDESHRTHYGELHIKMKRVFPNGCYIGFTGTPLMKKEKRSTVSQFGGFFHVYNIADGVRDKIIVPLLYEGKMVDQTINRKAIDNRLEIITRNLNEKQKEAVMRKWSHFEKIASSDQRIKMIAFDINNHFIKMNKTSGIKFKGMLATNSKKEAIRYFNEFEALGDLKTKVIISPPNQKEGNDEVNQETEDIVKKFWNKIIENYSSDEEYEEYVKEEFVNGDEVDLLIVVDKLLTGFDVPRANVIYIDKELKEHTLLQAIARVNRLYDGKDFGFIIDYRGLLSNLNVAMGMYSGAGLEHYDPNDLKGSLYDVIEIIGSIRQSYTNLNNVFSKVKNKDDSEEYQVLLSDDELREKFYELLSKFGRYFGIALEIERIYTSLSEEEIDKYKKAFKFYQELRKNVKFRYSDTIDHKEYEGKMQNLIDNYIAAEEILRITNPVDIMDEKGFEAELERLGSPSSKADAIRTRIAVSISEKWNDNPAYYKKFSERIEETLKAYKEMRINEIDYFNKMLEIMDDYKKGDSSIEYPEVIKYNNNAKAFYGVAVDVVKEKNEIYGKEKSFGELSLEIEKIIEESIKVDWHNNVGINNLISQKLDDLLYNFYEENNLQYDYPMDIDRIIDTVKTVAIRRYK